MNANKPINILIIDDEPAIRQNFKAYFEDFDYSVFEAENGNVGLKLIEECKLDLIFCDLQMPEISGFEVLEIAKVKFPEIPIVVISGNGITDDALRAIRVGAWDYILKPVNDMQVVEIIISRVLEKAKLKKENRLYREHLETEVDKRTEELQAKSVQLSITNEQLLLEISERKNAEYNLAKLNTELNVKNKELEQIVHVTSHDLRTPLVNIKGFSEELKLSINDLLNLLKTNELSSRFISDIEAIILNEIPFTLEIIESNILKIDSLLSGIHRYSKQVKSSLDLDSINTRSLVNKVIESVGAFINKRGIKIYIIDVPDCYGDEEQLFQVFYNLISNSAKFIPENKAGEIKIYGSLLPNYVKFTIEDNGIGIPENLHEKVFEIFFKANFNNNVGEGLGLTITRKIIDRHNGKIWVESVPNERCKIHFILPKLLS